MALSGIHPSVLVTCKARVSSPGNHGNAEEIELSGSGFILDTRSGLVATSASWLIGGSLLQLSLQSSETSQENKAHSAGLNWHLSSEPENTCFHVITQEVCPLNQSPSQAGAFDGDVVCMEAQIHGIYIMESVFASLEEQMSSLANWRSSSQNAAEAAGKENKELQTLLLPLSCLVMLQLSRKDWNRLEKTEQLPNLHSTSLALCVQ